MEIPLNSRDQVNQYIRNNFIKIPETIRKYEKIAKDMPIPPHHISPELGKLLMILVKSVKAETVLEIGTMWGFSAWWLYQGIKNNKTAKLITLDKDLKHFNLASKFFADMQMNEQVELRLIDALDELKIFKAKQFDFIFLDADKKEYPQFYQLLKDLIKPGGMLVVDNVIFSSAWKNKTVVNETENRSIKATQKFNKLISQDKSFVSIPVAVNSGIMVCYKLK